MLSLETQGKMTTTTYQKRKIFFLFFGVTIFLSLIVQFVIPYFFPKPFEHGLMIKLGDSLGFHHLGLSLANELKINGLFSLQWKGDTQLPGVILGYFYYLTGVSSPALYIPINALFLGLTAVVLSGLIRNYMYLALLLMTPTSLGWITQVSKDIFIVFAISCVLRGLIEYFLQEKKQGAIWYLIGAITILIVKNHYIEILLIGTVVFYLITLVQIKFRNKNNLIFIVATLVLLTGGMKIGRVYYATVAPEQKVSYTHFKDTSRNGEVEFKYEEKLPVLDKVLIRLSYAHFNFTNIFKHGNEKYFPDWKLNSGIEVLKYMPISVIYGFLDPLPWKSRWDQGKGKGALFLILQLELLFFYLAIYVLIKYFRRQSPEFKMFIIGWTLLSAIFILVFGFASPNLGAINRYRFPFLMTLKGLALMSWLKVKQDNIT